MGTVYRLLNISPKPKTIGSYKVNPNGFKDFDLNTYRTFAGVIDPLLAEGSFSLEVITDGTPAPAPEPAPNPPAYLTENEVLV